MQISHRENFPFALTDKEVESLDRIANRGKSLRDYDWLGTDIEKWAFDLGRREQLHVLAAGAK